MFRVIIFLLFFIPVGVCAQSRPKTKASRPKISGSTGSGDAGIKGNGTGSSGIQVLTIPVTGNYKLGMLKKEYDSIRKKEKLTIAPGGVPYEFTPFPDYIGRRIFALELVPVNETDADVSATIIQYFTQRFGEPDSKATEERKEVFPAESDSTLTGEYSVKETRLQWKQRKYELSIQSKQIEISKDVWKSNLKIRYFGDREYRELLYYQEERAGY